MKTLYLFFAFIFFWNPAATLFAQNISGNIKSQADQSPLAFANVFLNNTQIGVTSTEQGSFRLQNVPPGTYELIVSYIGYEVYQRSIRLEDQDVFLEIEMQPKNLELEEIVVQDDKNWQLNYDFFIENFIGVSAYSPQCTILNPDIVDLYYDYDSLVLSVSTDEFLIIENQALGYRIKYLLSQFRYESRSRYLSVLGYSLFEEMKGSKRKQKKWKKNRQQTYLGSLNHFYKSLLENTWSEEGYKVQTLKRVPNPNRQAEDSIKKALKSLIAQGLPLQSDTLRYWRDESRKPKLVAYLDTNAVPTEQFLKAREGYHELSFPDFWQVIYTREKESLEFIQQYVRPKRKPSFQTSIIGLLEKAYFDAAGHLVNPLAIVSEGYWAWQEKVAQMLPLDYHLQMKAENQEK